MDEFTLSSDDWQQELTSRINAMHGVRFVPLDEFQSETRTALIFNEKYYALEPFAIGVEETGGKVSVLRESFDLMLSQRSERLSKLKALLSDFGIDLDGSHKSLVELNSFFILNFKPEPGEFHMTQEWREFCIDTGIYLGELKIEREPSWEWVVLDDRRDKNSSIYHQIGLRSEKPKGILTIYDHLFGYANQCIRLGVMLRNDIMKDFSRFVNEYSIDTS